MEPTEHKHLSKEAEAKAAEEKKAAEAKAAEDAKAAAKEPEEELPTFTHDSLIQRAHETVGYAPHVIAGALSKVQKKNLTIEEAQEACRKFLGEDD